MPGLADNTSDKPRFSSVSSWCVGCCRLVLLPCVGRYGVLTVTLLGCIGLTGCRANHPAAAPIAELSATLDEMEESLKQIEDKAPAEAEPMIKLILDRQKDVHRRIAELLEGQITEEQGGKLKGLLSRLEAQSVRLMAVSVKVREWRAQQQPGKLPVTPPVQPKEIVDKDALKPLQGRWCLVSLSLGGKDLDENSVKSIPNIEIVGNQLKVEFVTGKPEMQTLVVDPTKNPATIDITTEHENQKLHFAGIYKLDGETLTICRSTAAGGSRPDKFEKEEKVHLSVFQRVR